MGAPRPGRPKSAADAARCAVFVPHRARSRSITEAHQRLAGWPAGGASRIDEGAGGNSKGRDARGSVAAMRAGAGPEGLKGPV